MIINRILRDHITYMITFLQLNGYSIDLVKNNYILFRIGHSRLLSIKCDNPSKGLSVDIIERFYNNKPHLKREWVERHYKKIVIHQERIEKRKNKPSYQKYIRSKDWQARSLVCIIGAGKRCEVCSSIKRLQSHHYNYENLTKETDNDLFCLCKVCHDQYHSIKDSNSLPKDNLPRVDRLYHIKTIIFKARFT